MRVIDVDSVLFNSSRLNADFVVIHKDDLEDLVKKVEVMAKHLDVQKHVLPEQEYVPPKVEYTIGD